MKRPKTKIMLSVDPAALEKLRNAAALTTLDNDRLRRDLQSAHREIERLRGILAHINTSHE